MAGKKKPKFEYVEALQSYRKRIKDSTGKYVSIYGQTPAELEEKLVAFTQAMPEKEDNPPVNSYIDDWFNLNCSSLSDATKRDYLCIINHHIKPYMLDKRIQDIYPNDIKAVIAHTTSLSSSVHNKTYMLLKRMFTDAFRNGDIAENPCPMMHNGGIDPSEKTALTDDQSQILLDAIKETRAHLFCMIALFTGMRLEEILGLMWDCVYLDETPRVDVRRAVRFSGNRPVGSTTLKSNAAKRTIPIPPQLVECLKQQKDAAKTSFVMESNGKAPLTKIQFRRLWDLVSKRQAKERVYYRYINGVKTPFKVEAKLGEKSKHGNCVYSIDFEVTPHILRHTYVSNLLLAGVDIKTVQYLAGHEKSKTTLDIYAHLAYNKPEDTITKVRKAFGQPSAQESV